MAICKFDEPELRAQIVDNCLNLIENPKLNITLQDSLAGLLGIAQSATNNEKSKDLALKLSKRL